MPQCVIVRHQAGAPIFSRVQGLGLQGRRCMLFHQCLADRGVLFFGQQAHELADELHLPALALEVGDAFGLGDCIDEFVGQAQAFKQFAAQGQQVFAEFLDLQAFTLEVGARGLVRSFELAFVFQIQGAALGYEVAFDVVALFQFSRHSQVS